jgi:hypothetical protein
MFWPFSRRWFISGADIFPQTIRSVSTLAGLLPNLRAVLVEIAVLLPIVLLVWGVAPRTRNLKPKS